jgi:transglutaminase/protease-like cytokinesis protein 3
MYSYSYQYSGKRAYVQVSYLETPQRIAELQGQVQAKVTEVVGSITTDSMSEAAKVTAINDYLVNNAEYDMAAYDVMLAGGDFRPYWYTQDVYGILLGGLGVCASYSRSFDILADAAGLDSVYVNGDVYVGGSHAWNKVKVDGVWRAVDVTWNDSPGGNDYLMIRDADFTGDSARQEGSDWMNDLLIGQYVTP